MQPDQVNEKVVKASATGGDFLPYFPYEMKASPLWRSFVGRGTRHYKWSCWHGFTPRKLHTKPRGSALQVTQVAPMSYGIQPPPAAKGSKMMKCCRYALVGTLLVLYGTMLAVPFCCLSYDFKVYVKPNVFPPVDYVLRKWIGLEERKPEKMQPTSDASHE